MSYSIYIGERTTVESSDGEIETDVEQVENKEAPYFSDSGYENSRHPGYGQMHEFCKMADVLDLWYGNDGFLKQHPGFKELKQNHLDVMKSALKSWQEKYPAAKAQMIDESPTVVQDGILARLVWYVWWMEWALNNCKDPVVANW